MTTTFDPATAYVPSRGLTLEKGVKYPITDRMSMQALTTKLYGSYGKPIEIRIVLEGGVNRTVTATNFVDYRGPDEPLRFVATMPNDGENVKIEVLFTGHSEGELELI